MAKKRESIVTPCMDCCYICGTISNIHIHHIYGGPNRNNSEKYGLIIPLCADHHNMSPDSAHLNPDINKRLKVIGQEVFETKVGTREEFIQIFGKSYILD